MVKETICYDIFSSYPIDSSLSSSNSSQPFNRHIGIGGVLFAVLYFLNCFVTLGWVIINQKYAKEGVEGAVRYVIFPIYMPLLWASVASDIIVGIVLLLVPIDLNGPNSSNNALAAAFAISAQHIVLEGIAFMLTQYGCGIYAVKKAFFWTFLWGVLTFIVQYVGYLKPDGDAALVTLLIWNSALSLFYSFVWIVPDRYYFFRVAVRSYARFWSLCRLLFMLADVLRLLKFSSMCTTVGNCLFVGGVFVLYAIFKPYLIYWTLLLDSQWWQGMMNANFEKSPDDDKQSITSTHRFINIEPNGHYALLGDQDHDGLAPPSLSQWAAICRYLAFVKSESPDSVTINLLQVDEVPVFHRRRSDFLSFFFGGTTSHAIHAARVEFDDAQELALQIGNIGLDDKNVKLLNFAYLSFDRSIATISRSSDDKVGTVTSQILGSGSFSKVYAGKYRGLPVAIKLLFSQDLNPFVISRYRNEAHILSELGPHPNVVNILGIAILPPNLCLVLEMCEFGSLSDILRGGVGWRAYHVLIPPTTASLHSKRSTPSVPTDNPSLHEPLYLSNADRMFLAYGCAQGVERLHNYSRNICHRDIKSYNFLVDAQLNAKIADLELVEDDGTDLHGSFPPSNAFHWKFLQSSSATRLSSTSKFDKSIRFAREVQATWQAPEVLLGQKYTQKSDIYSLTLVLWEIIAAKNRSSSGFSKLERRKRRSQRVVSKTDHDADGFNSDFRSSFPFFECRSQLEIKEKVVRGVRPVVPGGFDRMYTELLTRGWHSNPSKRPHINEFIEVLRKCWLNCVHSTISETPYVVDLSAIKEGSALRPSCPSSPIKSSSSPAGKIIQIYKERFERLGNRFDAARGGSRMMVSRHDTMEDSSIQSLEQIKDSVEEDGPPISGPITPITPISIKTMPIHHQEMSLTPNSKEPIRLPSAAIINSITQMQRERKWTRLEDLGEAFLVVSSDNPHYILWATRSWVHLFGFQLNEVMALELVPFLTQSPHLDQKALLRCLQQSGVQGETASHFVAGLSRRDGRSILCSVHFFPVYRSGSAFGPSTEAAVGNEEFEFKSDFFSVARGGASLQVHRSHDGFPSSTMIELKENDCRNGNQMSNDGASSADSVPLMEGEESESYRSLSSSNSNFAESRHQSVATPGTSGGQESSILNALLEESVSTPNRLPSKEHSMHLTPSNVSKLSAQLQGKDSSPSYLEDLEMSGEGSNAVNLVKPLFRKHRESGTASTVQTNRRGVAYIVIQFGNLLGHGDN